MKKQAKVKGQDQQDKQDQKTGKIILGIGAGLTAGYLLWKNRDKIKAMFSKSNGSTSTNKPTTIATKPATTATKPATTATKPTTTATKPTITPTTTKYALAIQNTILYKDWSRTYGWDSFSNKLLGVGTGYICGVVREYDDEMVKLQQKINGIWYTHYVHRDDVKFIEHGDTTTAFKQWTSAMATNYNNARIQY
jgi:hypothetical protein